MTEFAHEERLSREKAAERLTDIAFALTVGQTLDLRIGGERVRVPVADDVLLKRQSTSNGDGVDVEVVLIWST